MSHLFHEYYLLVKVDTQGNEHVKGHGSRSYCESILQRMNKQAIAENGRPRRNLKIVRFTRKEEVE